MQFVAVCSSSIYEMCEFRANDDFMMFKHNANICCALGSVQGRCCALEV
jgi:hypothetical protein